MSVSIVVNTWMVFQSLDTTSLEESASKDKKSINEGFFPLVKLNFRSESDVENTLIVLPSSLATATNSLSSLRAIAVIFYSKALIEIVF